MKNLWFSAAVILISLLGSEALSGPQEMIWLKKSAEDINPSAYTALTTQGLHVPAGSGSTPGKSAVTSVGEKIAEWSWSDLGIPAGYNGAGIAISYPYLYLVDQDYPSGADGRIWVLDIDPLPPHNPRWVSSPADLPWGICMDNDSEGWVSHVGSTGDRYIYEFERAWPMNYTGNSFYYYPGYALMCDGSDNFPKDTIWGAWSASTSYIVGYAEPGGARGRDIGGDWSNLPPRALTWNNDNGTFVVGGWNHGLLEGIELYEVSYADGSKIPMRQLDCDLWTVSGCAYQEESFDGTGKMWVQHNSYDDMLQLYEFPAMPEDDIALLALVEPAFPFIGPGPLRVKVECANLGTLDQDFTIFLAISCDGTLFEADMEGYLAASTTGQFPLPEWENGLDGGQEPEICVWIVNTGDEDTSNDGPICTSFQVSRPCESYITDEYPDFGDAFYMRDAGYILAKEMRTSDTRPVALVWGGINTVSKGEPYYPWPDPIYDPVEIGIYTDDDLDGVPDSDIPAWADTIAPDDSPWITFSPPYCSHLGQGGVIWVGLRNYLYPAGREGLVVDPYPRDHYDTWYYDPNSESWQSYNGYGDWHIRGCLEYPPPVTLTGLDELQWAPPYPQHYENPAIFDFNLTLCIDVEGSLSCSPVIRETDGPLDPDWVIPPEKVLFDPVTFDGLAGETLPGQMIILIPCGALEGVYNGTIRITHSGGIEEVPFKLTIGICADLDIQDYAGNLSANTMALVGVRDGVAVGVFKMNNPNTIENNSDLHDGPANSHLYSGRASSTDLSSCGGDPDPKEPIPGSEVEFVLGDVTLASGQGTYGVVTVNIPFYAKQWHPQYDYAYCGKITAEYEDRTGMAVSDMFDVQLKVLKSSSGMSCGFWGERDHGTNLIHWDNLGIEEEGYVLYRDGVKIAELEGEYEYIDPVATDAVFDYSLGVEVGGSEIMIGPISVGGFHVPNVFSLSQNHPNPFGEYTSISYAVGEASDISIGVYTPSGMLVESVINEYRPPGVYTVDWKNVDLPNGIYFYRMEAGDFSMTKKMVVLK